MNRKAVSTLWVLHAYSSPPSSTERSAEISHPLLPNLQLQFLYQEVVLFQNMCMAFLLGNPVKPAISCHLIDLFGVQCFISNLFVCLFSSPNRDHSVQSVRGQIERSSLWRDHVRRLQRLFSTLSKFRCGQLSVPPPKELRGGQSQS